MYTYREACRYKDGQWEFVDVEDFLLSQLLSESRYTVITLNTADGDIAVLSPDKIYAIPDKTTTVRAYINSLTDDLPLLVEDFTIQTSVYRDITDAEKVGNDYILKQDIPFLIHESGLYPCERGVVRGIDGIVRGSSNSIIGWFDVGLPFVKHYFKTEDITRKRGVIPKRCNINNTLLVFGNSLVKLNSLFTDIGDAFTYSPKFIINVMDLYIDNVDIIPPVMVGIEPDRIRKDYFDDLNILAKILTHPLVYLIEYQYEYPLGIDRIFPDNGICPRYSDSLVMVQKRPTNHRVIHRHDRFELRPVVMDINVKNYIDNPDIFYLTDDVVRARIEAEVAILDYPVFKFK